MNATVFGAGGLITRAAGELGRTTTE